MTLLQKLGLTKESMSRMVGHVTPFKAVPTEIQDAILKEDKSRTYPEVRYLTFMRMEHQEQQNQQTTIEELQRWKQLCHELADCLGCGCTIQHGLCVQCHKAQKRYRAIQIPLR